MASGKGSTNIVDLLDLIFQATALSWAANANLYIALHTASPSAGGNQTTNEVTYTSYARVAVARTGAGWTIAGANAKNTAAITFPTGTGGGGTATDVSIGTAASGTGEILYFGALASSLALGNGVQPQFAINALTVTEA